MIRLTPLFLLVSTLPLLADAPKSIVDAVPDLFTPIPSDVQRLAGPLAGRMRANIEGYLEHVNVQELLQPFQVTETSDRSTREQLCETSTSGEMAGLFLEAAANSYDYSGDAHLRTVMDTVAQGLLMAQQPDGYLGTHTANQRWDRDRLFVHGAVLPGLLAYSRVTGNEEAAGSARRFANLLVSTLLAGKPDTSLESGAGTLLTPLLDLYRLTGDARYLSFCRRVVQSRTAETGMTTKPRESYNLLLYLSGLADLYRLTGDDSCLKSVVAGWKRIRDNNLTVTGSPLSFSNGITSPTESPTDACLTYAWVRLSLELFRLRGDPSYAEELERTLFNQMLAAQDPTTGAIDPCVRMAGTKKPALNIAGCALAESLSISMLPELIWGRYEGGIGIISYQPGRATVRLRHRGMVQLYAETNYPESGNVLLHIEPGHDVRFPLRLRVPAWTSKFTIETAGTRLNGTPGEFLVIDREWKKGDTVRITMDMTVQEKTSGAYPGEVAIQRGPQILASAGDVNPELSDLIGVGPAAPNLSLGALPGEGAAIYSIAGKYDGQSRQIKLVPFADATTYRVWMKASSAMAAH